MDVGESSAKRPINCLEVKAAPRDFTSHPTIRAASTCLGNLFLAEGSLPRAVLDEHKFLSAFKSAEFWSPLPRPNSLLPRCSAQGLFKRQGDRRGNTISGSWCINLKLGENGDDIYGATPFSSVLATK